MKNVTQKIDQKINVIFILHLRKNKIEFNLYTRKLYLYILCFTRQEILAQDINNFSKNNLP